jgi:hypothetical protein
VVTADAGLQRPVLRGISSHIALGLLAVVLFTLPHVVSGYIDTGNGEGWDGTDYARMLREGWATGTVITQNRPLVVWANWPAYAVTGNAVKAFDVMNYVYAFALAVMLSLMMERYGASTAARAVATVCIFLSIPFRLFAFYPVLIDLGACLVITIALWLILWGPRWGAAIACVGAALSREFAPAVMLFGVHRDLRRGTPLWVIAITYLPGAAAFVLLRMAVARVWAGRQDGINLEFFEQNLRLLSDPMFIGFFGYFLVTLAGGITIVVATQPTRCWRLIKEEPEWVSFVLPVLAASLLVGMDTLRYLTSLLPAVAVFFARCAREWSGRERLLLPAAALGLTVWTQQPFQTMDTPRYFADWFPYYVWKGEYPRPDPPSLWPEWGWRFIVVTASVCALLAFQRGGRPSVVVKT